MGLKDEINKALENVDDVTYRTRIGICNGCTHLKVLKFCDLCWCNMTIKAKLKSMQCEDNPPKWK